MTAAWTARFLAGRGGGTGAGEEPEAGEADRAGLDVEADRVSGEPVSGRGGGSGAILDGDRMTDWGRPGLCN